MRGGLCVFYECCFQSHLSLSICKDIRVRTIQLFESMIILFQMHMYDL
jgi:hypothetical protein